MKFRVETEIVGDTSEPNKSKVFKYVNAKCECGRRLESYEQLYEDSYGDIVCVDCYLRDGYLGTVQEVFDENNQ